MLSISEIIAQELNIQLKYINATITLLDEGATVPFIARYRKELTGAMDDNQLRLLNERLVYLRELGDRRQTILKSINEQQKLTPILEKAIVNTLSKTELEDLYLPYKPKRRTKAQQAIEAGLEPLAELLLNTPDSDPQLAAKAFIDSNKGIDDNKAALDGARDILMERFAEDAELLAKLRTYLRKHGHLIVTLSDEKKAQEAEKFKDYFDYTEKFSELPSHRMLAILRGRNEGFLRTQLSIIQEDETKLHPCIILIKEHLQWSHQNRAADDYLETLMRWTWQIKLSHKIESDLMTEKRQQAEADAILVFANNLKDLLLAAPAGSKTTLGLDPGFRSGVKFAVVDASGKILDHGAIYPHPPQKQWKLAIATLADLCSKHTVELISIGNGTASRETDALVSELLKQHPKLTAQKIMVNEAGASVYSASEFAAQEFPQLDVTIRGAISIARRLQDPLAELVKIEPKAIGVGQYQHDVNQIQLARSLDSVVEDCVNAVGVDLNTASEPLLTRVSGLTTSTAHNIVEFRQQHGAFKNRQQLLQVSRLGAKVFEQSAGFLRINNGENPLDASSVHPESYEVVERIATTHKRAIASIIGDQAFLKTLNADDYINDNVGAVTIKDILSELNKPGRDPRPAFKTASFKDGVDKLSDLKEGMRLEGVVTNVTNFGAFVDVGVHQDGLVHISALANTFVKDPRAVVKAGDIVQVKVLEVDSQRKRIALTMRMEDKVEQPQTSDKSSWGDVKKSPQKSKQPRKKHSQPSGALANAFAAALKNKDN